MTDMSAQADTLRALHHHTQPLLLANAWDVASARLIERLGYPAVATTSSGVAASLGYPDGEVIGVDEMLAVVGRVAAAVEVPVTADLEAGYGLPAEEIVERLLAAGAVGLNLEDGNRSGTADRALVDPGRQAEFLAAVKEAGRRRGVDVVLNARIDVYIHQAGPPETWLEQALDRGRRYLAAGADCVFPVWVLDETTIGALVDGLDGAVNVLYRPGAPSVARLAELGVRRISVGGGLARAALAAAGRAAARLLAGDASGLVAED